ncbi:hypothetical protein CY34DRAFT_656887 [Suillus luteus UH-Slu-Lm8-n1]|uniref:Uncharacterized protein n=1 Tax=Suillus luteus UH-Slu-Lm8-n1 TaxID=930992 RepID=A0A0D0BCS9_9AGAM|nr:hypothetical protein CY34DRAFT_656887 [Suillus luteus UH-Slu-Lm8-n1]
MTIFTSPQPLPSCGGQIIFLRRVQVMASHSLFKPSLHLLECLWKPCIHQLQAQHDGVLIMNFPPQKKSEASFMRRGFETPVVTHLG